MLAPRPSEDAERCERLAKVMLAPAQRDAYLELAKMWRKLANEIGNHQARVAAWERKNGQKPSMPPGVGDHDPEDEFVLDRH